MTRPADSRMHIASRFFVLSLAAALFLSGDRADAENHFNDDLLRFVEYRNLGPSRAGAWVSDNWVATQSPAGGSLSGLSLVRSMASSSKNRTKPPHSSLTWKPWAT